MARWKCIGVDAGRKCRSTGIELDASKTGWSQLQAKNLLNTPERFQLVSQDMHAHPMRSGILILSLTLVNLAQQPQLFPVLEITLLNTANQPVAPHQFQPTSYLVPERKLHFFCKCNLRKKQVSVFSSQQHSDSSVLINF